MPGEACLAALPTHNPGAGTTTFVNLCLTIETDNGDTYEEPKQRATRRSKGRQGELAHERSGLVQQQYEKQISTRNKNLPMTVEAPTSYVVCAGRDTKIIVIAEFLRIVLVSHPVVDRENGKNACC